MGAILLADDDLGSRGPLAARLRALGHPVVEVADGAGCLAAAVSPGIGLVVLDLALPDADGIDVVRSLRARSGVPVLVLTARTDPAHKVAALDAGADDYVTRPYEPAELEARIRAGLRRAPVVAAGVSSVLAFGPYELHFDHRVLRRDGVDVALTPNELGLLLVLASHPGRLLSHDVLLKAVWGTGYGTESSYLRTYIAQLRRKLGDDAARPGVIRTEPGHGYRWIAGPGTGTTSDTGAGPTSDTGAGPGSNTAAATP